MIPLQLASHNAICRNDWRGWELFKTGNGHNLGWLWTVDDRGILSYRTSVHFGRYWPCNGQNGHSKWKCYIYVFLYFVLYFSLIGTKKPTNICIHYHLPVLFFNFFFFTKYIQICMCLVSIKQTHAHKNRKSKYVPLCQNILKLTANFFHLSFEGKTTNAYICFGFLI